MNVDLLLRLLARLLPPLARQRYLEEWRADLVGAGQLGVPRRSILLGAVALIVRIDRDRPEHSGEPRGTLPRLLARRGGCLLVAAVGVLAGLYLTGGNTPDAGVAPAVSSAFVIGGRTLAVLAGAAAAWAVLLLIGAGVTAQTWLARASLLALVVGPTLVALSLTGVVDDGLVPTIGLLLLLAGSIGGLVVVAGSPVLDFRPRAASRTRRVPFAIGGIALLLTVVVLGGIDAVVWNPQSKVPGLPLTAIYTGMVERDGFDIGMNIASTAVWAGFWSAAGLIVAIAGCAKRAAALTPRRLVILMCGLVSAAIFFRFFATFGIGMSIADSFATSGGDGSVVSALLACTGQLALATAAIAFGWAPRPRHAVEQRITSGQFDGEVPPTA